MTIGEFVERRISLIRILSLLMKRLGGGDLVWFRNSISVGALDGLPGLR